MHDIRQRQRTGNPLWLPWSAVNPLWSPWFWAGRGACPYGFHICAASPYEDDDAVYVVGHDHEFVQRNPGVMLRQVAPDGFDHPARVG